MDQNVFDVIIVGAGLSGIAMSRFYLEVHPECKLLIIEKDSSIGGPWGRNRMYPGFWSQSGIRMSGFSDVPLTVPDDAHVFNDIFEAKFVTDYLEEYVRSHVYAKTSMRDRLKLNFAVENVEKSFPGWKIDGKSLSTGEREVFHCKRLIIATGTTSDPKMPTLTGDVNFGGTIVHQMHFGQFLSRPKSDHQKFAVLGAGKSAADIAYELAKAGKEVHWIIRESGSGPGAFTNPADNAKGPFLNDPELAATRLFATTSPPCFTPPTAWTRFLHSTALGNRLLNSIWTPADQKCKDIGNFHHRPGALDGFDKAESDVNGPFGMIQRPDFWDTIAKNVRVHRHDIDRLEDHTVALKNGPSLSIDVIMCATGFENKFPFLTDDQHIELGLPHAKVDDEFEKTWTGLEAVADRTILQRFPRLASPPSCASTASPAQQTTPNRLYNCIAPLYDRTIAFVGNVHVPNAFRVAEVQAVWTTALFDGIVELPSETDMRKDVAWVNAFNKRRYPTHGHLGNYFHYDMMGYIDRLLGEVGLSSHRKGWWADLVYPLIAKDLESLKHEYVEKYGSRIARE